MITILSSTELHFIDKLHTFMYLLSVLLHLHLENTLISTVHLIVKFYLFEILLSNLPVFVIISKCFQFQFQKDQTCVSVCKKEYKKEDDNLKFLKHGMFYSYQNRWYVKLLLVVLYSFNIFLSRILDNMPVAWCYDTQNGERFCSPGFPIGCYVAKDGTPHDACVIDVSFITEAYINLNVFCFMINLIYLT